MGNKSTQDIDTLFKHALQCHKSGRLMKAEKGYSHVLQRIPDHHDAMHMRILVAYQTGNLAAVIDLIDQVIGLDTPEAGYQSNLGIILHALDRTEEAAQCYRRAIEIKPNFSEAYFNLGTLLQAMGKSEEAVRFYQHAIELNPEFAAAQNNLGMLLMELGNIDKGIVCFRKAVEIDPNFAVAYNNLAHGLNLLGNLGEAVHHCRHAIQIMPDFPEAHANLGKLQLGRGRFDEALNGFRVAAHLEPENYIYWQYVSDVLNLKPDAESDEQLISDLEYCLELDAIDTHGAAKAATGILFRSSAISRWLSLASEQDYDSIFTAIAKGSLSDFFSHRLLLRLMENSAIPSFGLELLLTLIRKSFLQLTVEDKLHFQVSRGVRPFLYALAHQCFLNEYIYYQSADERDWLTTLKSKAKNSQSLMDPNHRALAALLGSYVPLYRFEWASRLIELAKPVTDEPFKKLIRYQIEGPWQELEIRAQIPCLTSITDAHSLAVQSQYEENPYPRWQGVKHLPPIPFVSLLKIVCPILQHVPLNLPERPAILIAGCGTGQHALQSALIHKNAEILALDISRSSLAYGMLKANRFGMADIEFAQGDILDLPRLNRRFDIIECVGVLHHLHDPGEGLRILSEALHPEGVMLIGLYSEVARADLLAAQKWVKEMGYALTLDDIRRCRHEMMFSSTDTRIKRCLGIRDFYITSECRDLLFHVQEHRFTLPQIKAMLAELSLEFLGFQTEDPSRQNKYKARFPEDSNMVSLDNWHRHEIENPETFIKMYQFWVRKRQLAPSEEIRTCISSLPATGNDR